MKMQKKIIRQGKAKLNASSEHQLAQVIVNRKDKEGKSSLVEKGPAWIVGQSTKGSSTINTPSINKVLREMAKSFYYSKIVLSESFEQFKISDELSNLLTFMTSFGKVPMLVMPYGVIFASDKFQETMSYEFFEFLETWLLIYMDNLLDWTLYLIGAND